MQTPPGGGEPFSARSAWHPWSWRYSSLILVLSKKTLAPLPGSIVMADFEVANSSKETAPAWGMGES
jgi:hypothetical protein